MLLPVQPQKYLGSVESRQAMHQLMHVSNHCWEKISMLAQVTKETE